MVSEVRRRPIEQTDPRMGLLFTRRLNANDVRMWQLDWPLCPPSTLDELERDVVLNANLAIDWTPPGGVATKVRYAPPSVQMRRDSAASGAASVTIEELLAYD